MKSAASAPASGSSSEQQQLASVMTLVRQLEDRVANLEALAHPVAAVRETPAPAVPEPPAGARTAPAAMLGLLGRTFLVLAGAFLIRVCTEGGELPRLAGVALGLIYAVVWALAANRAGAKGRPLDAACHAIACAVIAYPLLWEATTRFAVLPAAASAAVLLVITALLMAVALRHGLEGVGWTVALAGLGTGFALMAATSAIPVFCAMFLVCSAATLRLGGALRWPAALAADAAILSMAILAVTPRSPELARNLPAPSVLALALALVLVYLGSFVVRALTVPRSVRAFEVVQTLLILPIGFGGAVRVAGASGTGTAALGLAGLVIGLGCYGAAFTFVRRQTEGSSDFRFLTLLGLLLLLVSSPILLPAGWLPLHFALLGLVAEALGRRFLRPSLVMHGAALLCAAALASGLPGLIGRAFLAPPAAWPWPSLVVLAALVAGHLLLLTRRAPRPAPWALRLACFALGAAGLMGLAALALMAVPAADGLGDLAALRTAVLALAAMAAAALGRWLPAGDQGWMVYPLLGVTAVKLLLQDVPQGRPLTLTLAFACFGAALLVAPRLAKAPAP